MRHGRMHARTNEAQMCKGRELCKGTVGELAAATHAGAKRRNESGSWGAGE